MPRATLLLLLFAVLVACSGGDEPGSESGSDEPATRPVGVTIGYQAPAFALSRLDQDGELKLEELRGKVVLVSFWASWCGPCRVEIPALEEAWQRYKEKDAVIVGISIDDRAEDARGFLRMFPVTFPMAFDAAGSAAANAWEVMSLPTTVLLDKQGVVRRRHIGYTPQQLRDTLAEVDELLEE